MSHFRGPLQGDLVNDQQARRYLPNEWNEVMNLMNAPGGYTSLQTSISNTKSAAQIMSITESSLDPNSPAGRAFVGAQNQVAINRAVTEEGYKQASNRITAIQTLIDRINLAPDAKDIADLQARIQAEQAMIQNESAKLALLEQLKQSQRDIQDQQSREIMMQSSKGTVPRF